MMECKNKYPRYFVILDDEWFLTQCDYVKIDKMYDPVYYVNRNSPKQSIIEASWTENGCDANVRDSYWKEVTKEELALIL